MEGGGMLRNYFCPKCGAVADVKHYEAHTEAEYEEFQADYQRRRATWEERRAKRKHAYLYDFGPTLDWDQAERLTSGIQYGEHLAASCPRCTHRWVEPVLAATEATPLFDEVVAIFGRQAERTRNEVR
jgi:hypothetical protein